MAMAARLKPGETLGDRIMKVDHAGEHGAVRIYRAQIAMARWRAPEMVGARRGSRRCRSHAWCGLGGFVLGAAAGPAGRQAISATTMAVERVVLRHMREQAEALNGSDAEAVAALPDRRRVNRDGDLARNAALRRKGGARGGD